MKKLGFLLLIVFLSVSCSNSSNSNNLSNEQIVPNSSPIEELRSIETNNQSTRDEIPQFNIGNPIEQVSISNQLESFNLDFGQFKVVSSSQIDWPDTCLGIEQPGVQCIKKETPGYWVKIEANELQFDYHVDKDGKQAYPATPGLTWSREGGDKNLCDKLIIFLPDTALACWCQSGEMKSITVDLLDIISLTEYDQLITSLKKFDETTINHSFASDSEPFLTSLTIYGQGDEDPRSEEQQSILAFAQDIFLRITP